MAQPARVSCRHSSNSSRSLPPCSCEGVMVDDVEAILEVGSAAAVEIAASALAERGAKTGKCANCSNPLLGAYCAVCGQPTHTARRSVRALLHDFVVDIFNF